MQNRHTNREQYFNELAITSKKYYLPYLSSQHTLDATTRVLEIGCGEGGNLLPFAQSGCQVLGIDASHVRIEEAKRYFKLHKANGQFISCNIFDFDSRNQNFDIILCHDVIEHIADKKALLSVIHHLLSEQGVAFIAFPAWQMPFGGHQQICKSFLSKLPFIHLLPISLYSFLLKISGESEACIRELQSIRATQLTIECFERLLSASSLSILQRNFYFINPHYEAKFGLSPKQLPRCLTNIPYLRNFMVSSCFYLLKQRDCQAIDESRSVRNSFLSV